MMKIYKYDENMIKMIKYDEIKQSKLNMNSSVYN